MVSNDYFSDCSRPNLFGLFFLYVQTKKIELPRGLELGQGWTKAPGKFALFFARNDVLVKAVFAGKSSLQMQLISAIALFNDDYLGNGLR